MGKTKKGKRQPKKSSKKLQENGDRSSNLDLDADNDEESKNQNELDEEISEQQDQINSSDFVKDEITEVNDASTKEERQEANEHENSKVENVHEHFDSHKHIPPNHHDHEHHYPQSHEHRRLPAPKTEEIALDIDDMKVENNLNASTLRLSLPLKLTENLQLFTETERELAEMLIESGQEHLFEKWDSPGVHDDKKRFFFQQINLLDQSCSSSGGLRGYIQRAKDLLQSSARGENLFDDWIPSVPTGVWLDPSQSSFEEFELEGFHQIGKCAFVLVAGGLGERLGFNDIKIALPSETTTNTCYLELYIKTILAYQQKSATNNRRLPLAIMVSDDTIKRTQELLQSNHNFGMKNDQVILMKQEKVAALKDNDAHLALESDGYTLETRPHGHGDVHSLLYSTGLAEKWKQEGFEYVIFFQDTNGLGLFSLPACVGVSKKLDLEVNSIAIPRKAKQAIGAIVKLQKKNGEHLTVNVEYNQLDPLLRSNYCPEGDVNDPATGYSAFPGNINQLIFKLEPYVENLKFNRGIISEFVNPKYADETRFTFTKPTRLECMMQDYPKTLSSEAKVGFTGAPDWLCFSPVKNSWLLAEDATKKGIHPACAASGEADQYRLFAKLLQLIGANVQLAELKKINGINFSLGPQIVFDPFFVSSLHELKRKFPHPSEVFISSNSTLVIKGTNVVVSSLKLNGELVVDHKDSNQEVINGLVHNAGNKIELVSNESNQSQSIKIRGFRFVKVVEPSNVPQQDEETKYEEKKSKAPLQVPKVDTRNLKASTNLPRDAESSVCTCIIF